MEAKDKKVITEDILTKFPGTDSEMDIDWDIVEISFLAGRRNTLDLLRKTNVGAWEELLVYIGGGGAKGS